MPQPDKKPRRRWFQFSLRALLILVAAVAGLVFACVKGTEPYRRQRETMALIANLGGTYRTEPATGWMRHITNHSQDIVFVDLAGSDNVDVYLPPLTHLPKLRTLVVGGDQFSDPKLAALKQLATLRGLVLDSTMVTDEG